MYLLDYMNSHENWRELLVAEPYNIEIKQNGIYSLLKYNQLLSDFSLPEVLEARGSIFRKDDSGKWICVCRAMDKFANFSEPYAATNKIDWSKGVDIQEKIDGSLIKLFFDKGQWNIATNGTINAYNAECGDTNFGELFMSIIAKNDSVRDFFKVLRPSYTYWFELVSPLHNHIVVKYPEDRIYYLGCRNMVSMEEVTAEAPRAWLHTPAHFTYHSLEECIEAAHHMGENEEGYVCVSPDKENGSYLRIKVKGDVYLSLHRIRGNGALTLNRICEMWQEETLDDFLALCPEYTDYIEKFKEAFARLAIEMAAAYIKNMFILDRRDYAKEAMKYPPVVRAYMFAKYDNKCGTAAEYLKGLRAKALSEALEEKM